MIWQQAAFFWPSRTYQRAVDGVLAETSLSLNSSDLWPLVRQQHQRIERPKGGHGVGVRLVLKYVRWNLALYRALLEFGVERSTALGLIERIQWRIIEPLTAGAFGVSRVRGSSLGIRVRWLVDMMFRLLFTQPFRREVLSSVGGTEFNVTFCPFAEYLKAQGAPELTGAALCALDYHMARQWGVRLERQQTIAEGGEYCDFKFVVPIKPVP